MVGQKQHHVVNRAYLSLFCDPNADKPDTIWMSDLKKIKVIRSQPSSVGKRQHYYSFTDREGNRSTALEDMLSVLEDEAFPVLFKLALRDADLSIEERIKLSLYLATMKFRVPAMRDNIEGFMRRIYQSMTDAVMNHPTALEGVAKRMSKTPEEIEAEGLGELRQFYKENRDMFTIKVDPIVSLRPIIEQSEGIANILAHMHLSLITTNSEQSHFITSDNPVALRNPALSPGIFDAPGFGQKNVEVTFPITPYVTLLLTHLPGPEIHQATAVEVWELNSRIQGGADRFTFASDWYLAFRCLEGIVQGEQIRRRPPWERNASMPKRHRFREDNSGN